ncbi:MAG: GNAT family N-acetyltransferase [Aigarchaeota archaeon]|nr:GNAT family N-acetyltransferase [Aigarchaeota archaeon]MDW8092851.1 GNAT family N-acetyltransferase [Nitrososphaerota archaeon]
MERVKIRVADISDVERIIELVIRQRRLNEEFDPLLKTSQSLVEAARSYMNEAIKGQRSVLIVAEDAGKIVGVLKADLVDRLFYEPSIEGILRDFYILPEYRRKGLGVRMVNEAIKTLRSLGAGLITAEFPSQHRIAVEFYNKLGFRPLISIYARQAEES